MLKIMFYFSLFQNYFIQWFDYFIMENSIWFMHKPRNKESFFTAKNIVMQLIWGMPFKKEINELITILKYTVVVFFFYTNSINFCFNFIKQSLFHSEIKVIQNPKNDKLNFNAQTSFESLSSNIKIFTTSQTQQIKCIKQTRSISIQNRPNPDIRWNDENLSNSRSSAQGPLLFRQRCREGESSSYFGPRVPDVAIDIISWLLLCAIHTCRCARIITEDEAI